VHITPSHDHCLFFCLTIQLLVWNVSGQKDYPKWTNHFNRELSLLSAPFHVRNNVMGHKESSNFLCSYSAQSILFTKEQRHAVIISNLGIAAMIYGITRAGTLYGIFSVLKYYFVPWLAVSHWFIMITYLHHTDPELPHYRNNVWNFQRGAAATVDRPLLGWQGRFFLHDVAHYHVIHHFFPKMPFCTRAFLVSCYLKLS